MKELLESFLGDSARVAQAVKGETKRGVTVFKRTGRYIKAWVALSLAGLALAFTICWTGGEPAAVRGILIGSWLFSTIVLTAIVVNASVVVGMVALASTAGDELFGARFPNVEPATVLAWAKRAAGVIAWVEFLHLAAALLPYEAWQNPAMVVAAFMAVSVLAALAASGAVATVWGQRIMIATAVLTLLAFIGSAIPGVRDLSGALAAESQRRLTRIAAERELGSLPEDLLGRKLNELAELKRSAMERCGQFTCDASDRSRAMLLEAEIVALRNGADAPGEFAGESAGPQGDVNDDGYGVRPLPPPPTLTANY